MPAAGGYLNISPGLIYPNPQNPRKTFDAESMAELVDSVRQHGVLQPLVVVADEDRAPQMWRIVCGERRWRAAMEAGLELVPVVVKKLTPEQELECMIIENLQRKDVNPIEEANGFKTLLDAGGYTQEELAKKVGCSQSQIANRIRLLDLPGQVRESISRGIISPSHGKILAGYKTLPENILKSAVDYIVERETPVAQTENVLATLIMQEGLPLYNDWRYRPQFNTKECKKCDNRFVIKNYDGTVPYCVNKPCWQKKQEEATEKMRLEEEQKLELERKQEEARKKEEAEKRRKDNALKQQEIQEHIKKTADQVGSLSVNKADPGIQELITQAREVWKREIEKSAYGYSDDENSVVVDYESVITLEGILEYWKAKNEICKDATSMSEQLGYSTIIIQEQGILFSGSEQRSYYEKDIRGTIFIEKDILKIANNNGHVLDSLPVLPIYYRVQGNSYSGSKVVRQLLGIKTPNRTIMVIGRDSITMRKDIFARWIKLINNLPSVKDIVDGESDIQAPTPGGGEA
ncbi:MAG: ParB/RepB/Spo0J family partition protein [Peptococcaceae bacterium]|nr:ParB/RepB/Spo0J family partition protein [Peptococcaceae bacterium]